MKLSTINRSPLNRSEDDCAATLSASQKLRLALRAALVIFLAFRILLSLWMFGVRQVISIPLTPDPVLRPYLDVALEQNPWLEPWQRWDVIHYQAIAERGYSAFDTALFVPPLFPLLVHVVGSIFGGNTLLAGIVVSNLAFLGCLVGLYLLVLDEFCDQPTAFRAILYLASFPAAFFFFAGYTESLYLLGAVMAVYLARKGSWVQAGIWGAVAALARLPGVLIALPLAFAGWQAWRRGEGFRPWLAVAIALAGGAIFPLYTFLVLRMPPWTPFTVQEARFQGGFTFPGVNVLSAFLRIVAGKFVVSDLLDLLFILLFIGIAWEVWKRLPRIYSVYYLSLIGLFLVRMSGIQPLLGTARYVLALFPAFIILGLWGRNPWINRLLLYLSWIGLLFMSGQFALWGWVG